MASISFASESLIDPRIQVKLDKYQKCGNVTPRKCPGANTFPYIYKWYARGLKLLYQTIRRWCKALFTNQRRKWQDQDASWSKKCWRMGQTMENVLPYQKMQISSHWEKSSRHTIYHVSGPNPNRSNTGNYWKGSRRHIWWKIDFQRSHFQKGCASKQEFWPDI